MRLCTALKLQLKSFISKQINKLSSKKATGHDGISVKSLKFAKPVVLQLITFLINDK